MNRSSRRAGAVVAAGVLVLVAIVAIAVLPREPGRGTPGTPGPSPTTIAQASPPTPSAIPAPASAALLTQPPAPTASTDMTPSPSASSSPTAGPPPATATTVFFQSWGSGHHRLYRWLLDGVTKPEILLDRAVPLGDDGIAAESYSVSPDGSVALAPSTSPFSVTAFDLATRTELWSESSERSVSVYLWSTDSAVAVVLESDDDTTSWQRLDIATGDRSPVVLPDDWYLLGFERGTHSIVLSDVENGVALGRRFLLMDLDTGAQSTVGTEVQLGTVSAPLRVSPLLGARVEVERDAVRTVAVTNAATGDVSRVEVPGATDVTFDPTGERVLIWSDEGTDPDVEPRAALYEWQPGTEPVQVWSGEGSSFQDSLFALDGSALVFRGDYRVPSFSFVDLGRGATAAVPLPTDVQEAAPVAVIAGTAAAVLAADPFSDPPTDPEPGNALEGSALALSGRVTGSLPEIQVQLTAFAATDSRSAAPLATASFSLPPTTSMEVDWRVLHQDARGRLTIWVSSLEGCCTLSGRLWTWLPGSEPRRKPFPASMRPAYGVAASPDGRWLAGSKDQSLLLWDRETGTVTRSKVSFAVASVDGWTADGRSLLLYRGYGTEGQCQEGGTVSLFNLRTHRIRPYEGEALRTARGATYAPWGAANAQEAPGGRSFWTGDYCAGEQDRVRLPSGLQIDQMAWSGDASAAYILARDATDTRHLLRYRAGLTGFDETPERLALGPVPWDQIVSLDTVLPGGRWLTVQGEGRYAVGRSGLVDLRTGEISWLPYGRPASYAFVPPR